MNFRKLGLFSLVVGFGVATGLLVGGSVAQAADSPVSVAISPSVPTPKDTLSATVEGVNGSVQYEWYRGKDAIAGATESTYKITTADLCNELTVSARVNGVMHVSDAVTPQFTDTPSSNTYYQGVCWVAQNGITTGTGAGATYSPTNLVDRGMMSSFIYREMGSPAWTAPTVSPLADVPTSHPFYKTITWMAAKGITTPSVVDGQKYFFPGNAVTRGQMAVFLYKAAGNPAYTPPASSAFIDVATDNTFYKHISWLYSKGVTKGSQTSAGLKYQPTTGISRGQMAVFLKNIFPYIQPEVITLSTPTITGTVIEGQTLTSNVRLVAPAAATLQYQWYRESTAIAGATSKTYKVVTDDIGHLVKVKVTASAPTFTSVSKVSTAITTPIIEMSGEVIGDSTWKPTDGIYLVTDCLTVPTGNTLTMQAGLIVKFQYCGVTVDGVVNVAGTASSPVVLTSWRDDTIGGNTDGETDGAGKQVSPAGGDWQGIQVGQGDVSVDHAKVLWAYQIRGSVDATNDQVIQVTNSVLNLSGGVYVERGAQGNPQGVIRIVGNTLSGGGNVTVWSDSAQSGLVTQVLNNTVSGYQGGSCNSDGSYCSYSGWPVQVADVWLRPSQEVSGNVVTGNRANVIGVSGTLREDWTVSETGLRYVVGGSTGFSTWYGADPYGSLTVASGATWTVNAGAVVKFADGSVTVDGVVNVVGTASSPVVLTSLRDDTVGGDTDGATDYYAKQIPPAQCDWQGVIVDASGQSEMDYVEIRYACTALDNSGEVAVNAAFKDVYQIENANPGSATEIRGSFQGDVSDGRWLITACPWTTTECMVDAKYINWGTTEGPYPSNRSNPLACGAVLVDPWNGGDNGGSPFWDVPNCNGETIQSPASAYADTQEYYSTSGLDCSDPTYADVCQMVQTRRTCFAGAVSIMSSMYSVPATPEDWAVKADSTFVSIARNSSNSTLSSVSTVANNAFTVLGAANKITTVGQAYSDCLGSV